MTENIKVAVVGLGNIGKIHIEALQKLGNVEIVAVCDINPEVAEAFAQSIESSPKAFVDLDEMLSEPSLDLVSICLPSGAHVDAAKKVIEAGKHVVVEKPLDVDLGKAREFVALSEQHPELSVSVISQHRFDPATLKVLELAKNKQFGQITTGIASIAWWRSQDYYDSAAWRGTWAEDGGGALMNQGVHTLDLMLAVMGKPISVVGKASTIAHQNIEVEDVLGATIEFENGSLGVLHATTSAYPGIETSLQIMGDNGSAKIVNDELEYLHIRDEKFPVGSFGINGTGNQIEKTNDDQNYSDATSDFEPHRRQLSAIVDSLDSESPAGVNPKEAFLTMATVKAIYVASQKGHEVLVDDVISGKYDSLSVSFERP